MQPEASPRSVSGVPVIEATPGGSAPFSASANPILHVPVSNLHPGNVSFAPNIPNPLAHDPQATTRGMQDFNQFNCVGCHAANGGGGMGPALSEGQFIYGSAPANLFLSIYQGRPNGMPAWGGVLPESTIWELVAYVESIAHPADRDLRAHDLESATVPQGRTNAVGVFADGESMGLHDLLQQWPKAGRRVSRCVSPGSQSLAAACAVVARPCHAAAPMDTLHAHGLMARRILPLTQGLLIVSAAVVVVIAALVLIAILRHAHGGAGAATPLRTARRGDGFRSASASRQSCSSASSCGLR